MGKIYVVYFCSIVYTVIFIEEMLNKVKTTKDNKDNK